jgi:hypothetical protein
MKGMLRNHRFRQIPWYTLIYFLNKCFPSDWKNGSGQVKDFPEPFFHSRFQFSMEDADCTAFCKGMCLFVPLTL